MSKILPRYPIYVISKGRSDCCLSAKFLIDDKVPFHIVVEPQEEEKYADKFGKDRLYILPFSNLGKGSIPARNWVWEHAKKTGYERHWILDDNIRSIWRLWHGLRVRCDTGPAFSAVEDFIDRYENVAVAGLNYAMFVGKGMSSAKSPFILNCHVYSCLLIKNSLPQRWRGRYNEDTDLCLQVLAAGLCTVLINIFSVYKVCTMKMKGGNTAELYKGDGRLKMARALERLWPGVVETKRRFKRPQHVVKYAWRKFDTPLKLKPGLKIDPAPNEYGLELVQVAPIKSEGLKRMVEDYGKTKKNN